MLLPVLKWEALRQGRGLKILLISLGGVIALAGAGTATYYLWPSPPPKPPPDVETASLDESADYAASSDFNRLPMKQRVKWAEGQMQKALEMDDDELVAYWRDMGEERRDRIRDNMRAVMRERTKRHVNEYFKLSAEDRKEYLDGRIDEMQQWRDKARKMFPRGPGGVRDGESEADAEKRIAARRARFARGAYRFMREPADQRAKTIAYFSAFAKRRNERGLSRVFGVKPKSKKK